MSETERQPPEAADGEARAPRRFGIEQAEFRETAGERADGDATLEAREGCAQAEVCSAAEADVWVRSTAEVEAMRVVEHRRIAVGGRGEQTTMRRAGTWRPPITTGSRVMRSTICMGPSKRMSSSTAERSRSSVARSRASWSGWRRRASMPLPMRLAVVSCPATNSKRMVETSSSWLRDSPDSSAAMRAESMSSVGARLRSAINPSR